MIGDVKNKYTFRGGKAKCQGGKSEGGLGMEEGMRKVCPREKAHMGSPLCRLNLESRLDGRLGQLIFIIFVMYIVYFF